jgi:subtilase family serine protease
MFTKAYRVACAAGLILTVGSPGTSQMAVRDRIIRPIDSAEVAVVKGTAHPLARPEFDQGRASSELPIDGALVFRLSPAQQADLDALLRQQQERSSPNYHRWLTPEQYADRFGMTQNDLAKVSAWAKSQGLTTSGISRGRTELYFSGRAGDVENAFHTEIHKYVVKGKEHFANSTAISVPQAFADSVLGVRGLDNFKPKPMLRVHPLGSRSASAHFTSDLTGNHFLDPNDFAVIYDLNALYNATTPLDGTGINIAVIGQTEISVGNATTDLDAFRTAAGLPAKDPNFELVPNTGGATFSGSGDGDVTEADLDLEWSNAIAKNANVTFVFSGATGNAFDAIAFTVNQGLSLAQIISNSFGLCENDEGQAQELSLWQTVRQGNAEGQTMTSAAGDTGASDCEGDLANDPASATLGLGVDVPAAIPEVTGVGGTEFTGDSAACPSTGCPTTTACPNGSAPADSFWSGACTLTSPAATALSYIPEMVWNDTALDGVLAAGGGGASSFFGKPDWQTGTGVPADGARDVPDVAFSASLDHDAYLICSQGSCVDGFRNPNSTPTANDLDTVGGTSTGAPTFAGILALILQATKNAGLGGANPGLGNVNPMLYQLAASSPSAFHDITSGNNKVPCTSGTTSCPAGTASIGFSAGTGYDQASGLGSVDAGRLETAWLTAIASPPADFQIEGQSSTVAAAGQPGTATILVTAVNGFADTVNLNCTPSSTTAQITCALNPTSVALTSSVKSGTSTLSLTTVAALEKPRGPYGMWFAASGGLFAAVLLGGIPARRRGMKLLGLVLCATAIGSLGCGGGGGSGNVQQKQQGTPAGTYTITVTATGANTGTSHSATVNLVVQ